MEKTPSPGELAANDKRASDFQLRIRLAAFAQPPLASLAFGGKTTGVNPWMNAGLQRYGEMSPHRVEGGPRRREAAVGYPGPTAVKPWGSIKLTMG